MAKKKKSAKKGSAQSSAPDRIMAERVSSDDDNDDRVSSDDSNDDRAGSNGDDDRAGS